MRSSERGNGDLFCKGQVILLINRKFNLAIPGGIGGVYIHIFDIWFAYIIVVYIDKDNSYRRDDIFVKIVKYTHIDRDEYSGEDSKEIIISKIKEYSRIGRND